MNVQAVQNSATVLYGFVKVVRAKDWIWGSFAPCSTQRKLMNFSKRANHYWTKILGPAAQRAVAARLTQSVEWQALNLLAAGSSPASGFLLISSAGHGQRGLLATTRSCQYFPIFHSRLGTFCLVRLAKHKNKSRHFKKDKAPKVNF